MKTILKESVWVTLILLLFCFVFTAVSFSYAPKERLIPLSVGIAGLLLSALMLLSERYPELIRKFDVSADNLIRTDTAKNVTETSSRDQTPIRKTLQI